jgi:hypothetical protein
MIRIIGITATIICAGYFVVVGFRHAATLPALRLDSASVTGLALAILLFLAVMIISGFAWNIALRAAGEQPRLRPAMATVMLSQFAKYVPGNVAHIIGRVALARHYGAALSRVMVAMTFEISWNIVAAIIVAGLALLIEGPLLFASLPELSPAFLAIALVVALAIPVVSAWVFGSWRPAPLARLMQGVDVTIPGVFSTLVCIILYGAGFLLAGLALDMLARGPLGIADSHLALLTGVFAFAWIAGYVTPGAPGGLGVREAILVAGLGPVYGPGAAFTLALILRVCNVAADALGFLSGLLLRRSIDKNPPPP